jgi:esterase/lipase
MEWISLIVTFVLGGGLVAVLTVKPQKQKVVAEAKQIEASAESTEIDNAEKVAKMWREYAEASDARYQATIVNLTATISKMQVQMSEMETTVKKLTTTNNQILKILKEINHDNLEQKKQEAKDIAGA